jgi:thiol-disulfide isomerase/thioredoxin
MKSIIFTVTVLLTAFVNTTTIHAQQAVGDTVFFNLDSLKLQHPNMPDYALEDISKGSILVDAAKNIWRLAAYRQIYLLDGKRVSYSATRDTSVYLRVGISHSKQKESIFKFGEKARNGIDIYESKNTEDRFFLAGKIDPYYNGCPVMLFTFKGGKRNDDRVNTVDTAIVRNGEFYFRGKEYLADEAIITAGNYPEKTKSAYVILERGHIRIDMRGSLVHASGTPFNDTIAAYYKEMEEYIKFKKLQHGLDKELVTGEKYRKDLTQGIYLIRANYVRRNISNIVGETIFKKDVLKNDLIAFPFFDEIYSSMSEQVKADPDVMSSIRIRDRRKANEEQRERSIGQSYTDFEIQTPTGEKRKLSEYVGKSKYLFIDFWASWCGPCIAEIPFLKDVYAKYKAKGLEMVGISLDSRNDDWQKALKKVNAPWVQLCVKGDDDTRFLYDTYHFSAIPYSILLDENSKIIAAGLRGEELIKKIEDLETKR